ITKAFHYDGLGNVTIIEEGGQQNNSWVSGLPKAVTHFMYDSAGRQIATRQAATTHAPATETLTRYDALGRAVSTTQGGLTALKVYDNVGNVRFEISTDGNVIERQFNAFGQEVLLIQYADEHTIQPTGPITLADMVNSSGLLSPSNDANVNASTLDRRIHTQYDTAGRKEQVVIGKQTTHFTYNAFDQEIKKEQLLDNQAPLSTYSYYNTLGQKVASVDAGKYLSALTYNAHGEVASSTEYAVALSGSIDENTAPTGRAGNETQDQNRTTEFYYDDMGRVTHTVYQNVAVKQQGSSAFAYTDKNQVIDYKEYDVLGNVRTALTTSTDLANPETYTGTDVGASTLFEYDATGRLINKAQAYTGYVNADAKASKAAATTTQLGRQATSYAYDVLGNLVEQREHATRLTGHSRTWGDLTAPVHLAQDKVTRHEYNTRGQLIREYNALGHKTEHHYNAHGLLSQSRAHYTNSDNSSKSLLTSYQYDNNGQVTAKSLDSVSTHGGKPTNSEFTFNTAYNAFGEVKKDDQG
ncbi:hypothetical protein, partial [Pseudoalteromonas holothuriae]|uniref:hypothetical protein n=1 Tax=Pseudoalteromonas holothuriae TaxID=2963714 RepID=UPI0021C18328